MEEKELKWEAMYSFLASVDDSVAGNYSIRAVPKVLELELDGVYIKAHFFVEFIETFPESYATVGYFFFNDKGEKEYLCQFACHNKYLCDGISGAKYWIRDAMEAGTLKRIWQTALEDSAYDVYPGAIPPKKYGKAVLD